MHPQHVGGDALRTEMLMPLPYDGLSRSDSSHFTVSLNILLFCFILSFSNVPLIVLLVLGQQRPSPPPAVAVMEDEAEKTCGPTGFWEALTPCNGCHNLGFSSGSQVH